MDFYSRLFAEKLGGGSRKGDELFKLTVSDNLTVLTEKMFVSNGITKIGSSAFRGCTSLTSVEIPNSVTSIGSAAFYGCSRLKSVKVWANIPPSLGDNAFVYTPSGLRIYVPSGSVNAYKAATNWKNYASKIYRVN